MEKSIETIWKEGFLSNDALIVPKLNDLYNQKSIHVIDQFKRMFRKNLATIVIAASVLLALAIFLGIPYIGAFVFLLLGLQALVGKKELNNLENIDKGKSSYQYLQSFNQWLKEVITIYTRLNKWFYPLFFLAFMMGMWFNKYTEGLRDQILNDPDTLLVLGVPVFYVLPAILFAIIITVFSERIYRFDVKTIYGGVMKKLEELIADMEELNK